MAQLKETSALKALNEEDYINSLYDSNEDAAKKMLQEHYAQNTGALDHQEQQVQQQADDYVNRTEVEARKGQQTYGATTGKNLSAGAMAQAALTQGNQKQANVTSLRQQEQEADAEIQRQRQILGSQYAAEIRKAQADNDMERAQMLYDAAKAEEERLLALRRDAAKLMAAKGDNSIMEGLLQNTDNPYGGEENPGTMEEVLRNEGAINEIYDARRDSEEAALGAAYEKAVSDLLAQQEARQRQTDALLTDAYVTGLRRDRNAAQMEAASGLGSGGAAQMDLAREMGLQRDLTELRRLQAQADSGFGQQEYELGADHRGDRFDAYRDRESDRIAALVQAAEDEELKMLENQLLAGNQAAKGNDYSILGALYGLTPDQIDRLQGTGKYAPALPGPGEIRYTENNVNPYMTPEQYAAAVQRSNDILAQKLIRDERLR